MATKSRPFSRIFLFAVFIGLSCLAVYGLVQVNAAMEVRYQAVGKVTDENGTPLDEVEVLLTLSPPPSSPDRLDALFREEAITYGRMNPDGQLKRPVGPVIGLSDSGGGVVVRAVGRLGAAHAIRLGLDSSGRPPFEVAWVVMRKEGYQDATLTMSIMGWRTSPAGWGRFANRLPRLQLSRR